MATSTENIKGLMANPKTRLLVIISTVLVIGTILASVSMLRNKSVPAQLKPEVKLGQSPTIASTPGATENQKYVDANTNANNKKFDDADKIGGSSLPTPVKLSDGGNTIGSGSSSLGGQLKPKPDEQIPNTQAPQLPNATISMPPPVVVPQPYRNQSQAVSIALPQNIGKQLDVLLERWAPTGQNMETDFTGGNRGMSSGVAGTAPTGSGPRVNVNGGPSASGQLAAATMQPGAQVPAMVDGKMMNIPAASLYGAVLTTGIDTDEPGPVLAEIVEGPFAGSKLIGTVTTGSSQTSEKATLQFNIITTKGAQKSAQIKAYAVNQETARTGLATDVDHHYLERYGLLFAASFMNGFGTALASAGTTVVTSATGVTTTSAQSRTLSNLLDVQEMGTIALGNVGKDVSKALAQNVTRPVTVRVAPGTPIAVLFMQDVMVPVK